MASTELYPNWTLFSTPHASPEVVRAAALTILNLKPDEENRRWGVASDFSTVDQLYRQLRLGPYEYLRGWTLRRIWEEWRDFIVGTLVLFLALILHGIRTSRLLEKRTRELHQEAEARQEAENQKYQAQQHILRLQKTGAVGQISTIVAHELRQPLGTIVNYARGLLRLAENQESGPFAEKLSKGMRRIQDEAYKADEIVTKVRNFAKGKGNRLERVDLEVLLNKAADSIRTASFAANVEIKVKGESVRILSDPLEVELVLINLLKNAVEAASMSDQGVVTAAIEINAAAEQNENLLTRQNSGQFSEESYPLRITIRDNGPRLSPEKFAALNVPLNSVKSEGLGLGLSIVRGLLEDIGGVLLFKQLEPQGIEVSVLFQKSCFENFEQDVMQEKEIDTPK